eukprot:gene11367-12695_t
MWSQGETSGRGFKPHRPPLLVRAGNPENPVADYTLKSPRPETIKIPGLVARGALRGISGWFKRRELQHHHRMLRGGHIL